MAPIIMELKKYPKYFNVKTCVSAQHREMLDEVLRLFNTKPDYDLNVMRDDQSLTHITSSVLKGIENLLMEVKPDLVLVQGDTTTTFAASLACFYQMVKIGHVEAGLRTNNKYQPFPEEINRRLTTYLADLHFAPTEWAKRNLLKEGIDNSKIFVTGNTVIDALLMTLEKQRNKKVQTDLGQIFFTKYNISLDNRRFILVTGHRRESFGKDFENICYGLKKIAQNNPDVLIIYPVHLNPSVQRPVQQILRNIDRIHLIEPLDYNSFVWLMNHAYLILTDSGGVQEEAPLLGKPVLVMRNITERPEGIEAGTAKLVGTDSKKIIAETTRLLKNRKLYKTMAKAVNPYGDGKAAERIVASIITCDERL